MERRVLLAISLSFLVLFLYQTFLAPPPPPRQPPSNSTAPAPGSTIAGAPPPGNATPIAPVPLPPLEAVVGEAEARDIVIDTDDVHAVFTNRGGRLRRWQLKKYKNAAGQPIDLIPETVPAPLPIPFSLRVDDAVTTARLNESIYKVTQQVVPGDGALEAGETTLTFELETGDGLRVRKTFAIAQDSYDIRFSASVSEGDQPLNPIIDWGAGLDDEIARMQAGSFLSPNYLYAPQAIFQPANDDDPERIAAASIGSGLVREGEFIWAGIDDHYFISAIVRPAGPIRLEYAPVSIPSTAQPPVIGHYVSYSVRLPAPPENVRFFFGPKELDELRAVDVELTKAIYFGMFAFLAAPLLGALKWVYAFVGNWGWAIITLTILINLAMFPLRHKSVVSMRKMQELQPQMKAIQDRYAKYKITDPERQNMNKEVMELYKAKGVNPASGCVPMLLTMPFLFAFYSMLSQAIEIRGGAWVGWINDLAAADPYYILPILTGVTMVWQQKMTPAAVDPTQQKVMMMMPVMFTFIFLSQPSGLSLYWLVSQLFTIGQQYFTNYLIGPAKSHNVRPAETVPKSAKDVTPPKPAKDVAPAKPAKEKGSKKK
jgi:YidC/Oxa1 family membrane protein insertase